MTGAERGWLISSGQLSCSLHCTFRRPRLPRAKDSFSFFILIIYRSRIRR